jgi:hypothetical protein
MLKSERPPEMHDVSTFPPWYGLDPTVQFGVRLLHWEGKMAGLQQLQPENLKCESNQLFNYIFLGMLELKILFTAAKAQKQTMSWVSSVYPCYTSDVSNTNMNESLFPCWITYLPYMHILVQCITHGYLKWYLVPSTIMAYMLNVTFCKYKLNYESEKTQRWKIVESHITMNSVIYKIWTINFLPVAAP